jgi:2-polyprenyl-3-methyl-5-hydroxy-6-metoxy-1,4-benzoquinol methylase
MNDAEYERMFRAEDHHWWYLGMAAITRALLDRHVPRGAELHVLDAGCGTGGAMSTILADYGAVTGTDLSPIALRFCRTRRLTRICLASVDEIALASGSFDIVTSFDVIYESHVRRDFSAVAEYFRVLRPGGFLLLREPAFDWLRGEHDNTVEGARRYDRQSLRSLLRGGGFEIIHETYANAWLLPLVVVKRQLFERLWPPASDSSDLSYSTGILNELFRTVLSSEAKLAARLSLPFGSSVFALARKPPG